MVEMMRNSRLMVRKKGVEPLRNYPYGSEPYASASSATSAEIFEENFYAETTSKNATLWKRFSCRGATTHQVYPKLPGLSITPETPYRLAFILKL